MTLTQKIQGKTLCLFCCYFALQGRLISDFVIWYPWLAVVVFFVVVVSVCNIFKNCP